MESDTHDSMISEIIDADSDIELSNSSDGNSKTSRKGENTGEKSVYMFFLVFFFEYIFREPSKKCVKDSCFILKINLILSLQFKLHIL